MKHRGASLLLVLVLALCGGACVDGTVLQDFSKLNVQKEVLESGELTSLMAEGRHTGEAMGAAAMVLLCLYLGFRANQGQPWLGLAKECFLGGVVCAFILSTYTSPNGPVRMATKLGWELYDRTVGPKSLFDVLAPVIARSARWIVEVHRLVEQVQDAALRQDVEAFLYRWTQTFWSVVFGANMIVIFLLRQVLLCVYSFLVAFYWVLIPYVAWTVVLPQTRPIFKGFVQSYIAVCLWPLFLGLTERLITSLPWSTWVPVVPLSDLARGMALWTYGQVVIMSMNTVFVAAISAIPVVASKTVSGAVRSAVR